MTYVYLKALGLSRCFFNFCSIMVGFILLSGLFFSCSQSPAKVAPQSSCHAIIVDATTNKALIGVTVENQKTKTTLVSDAKGHILVAAAPVQLRLNHIGYAPLEITREGTSAEQPDTLRLLPTAIVLANVVVRPTKQIRLTSVEPENREKSFFGMTPGRELTPGSALAVLHRPPDTAATYRLTKLVVGIPKQHEAEAGRLRVRLVNVDSSPTPHPGPNDLLPVAAIFTAQQVNDAPNHELEIDVSAYGIRLPKEGLCIIVECLTTEPSETRIGVNQVVDGHKVRVEVITATDPKDQSTYKRTSVEKFIWVSIAHSAANAVTWRLSPSNSWVQSFGIAARPGFAAQPGAKAAPTTNALVDMVVEPE